MAQNYSDLDFQEDHSDLGFVPEPSSIKTQSSIPLMTRLKDAVVGSALGVGQGLYNLGSSTVGTFHDLMGGTPQQKKEALIGLGRGPLLFFQDVAERTSNPELQKAYSEMGMSSPLHIQPTGNPAENLSYMTTSFLPVGRTAQAAEGIINNLLGKNLLSKVSALAAGGAASAPLMGVDPLQGSLTNLLLGGAGSTLSKLGEKVNKVGNAYKMLAPQNYQELSHNPLKTYQEMGRGYMGLKNEAGDIFDNIENDPRINGYIHNPTDSFFNTVKDRISEYDKKAQTDNVKAIKTWMSSFLPQETYTGITGNKIPTNNGKTLNSFRDYRNIYQEINDVYKTENVKNNPLFKSEAYILKNSLNNNLNEMASNLPPDLLEKFKDANDLWVKKSEYERLPNSTEISPFYRQFIKEKNPNDVANGIGGNPSNFMQNYFPQNKNVGMVDNSVKTNHLLNLVSPETKSKIASSFLNPQGLQNINKNELKNNLNKLNEEQINSLFGQNAPLAHQLKSIVNKPGMTSLSKYISKVLGLAEGMKMGHPFMGYILGSLTPNLLEKETIVSSTGKTPPSYNFMPSATTRRQYGYLPAALNYQGQNNG